MKRLTTEFSPVKKAQINEMHKKNNGVENHVKGPILLESSPITRKIEQNEKRKSFVGLLETNLDYIETDLDVAAKKVHNLHISNTECLPSVEKEKSIIEECIPESTSETEHSSVVKEKSVIEECIPESIFETEEKIDDKSETDKLDKLSQIDNEIKEVIEVSVNPTITLDKSKIEVIDEKESQPVCIPVETENPVLDLDKKLTNLIYEDQHAHVTTPKQTKPKNSNRTPLGDRNRVNSVQKSAVSKLRVHDKPRNDYAVSKIPVFKDKSRKPKSVQCENTPPRFLSENIIKKSQWDSDKTIII